MISKFWTKVTQIFWMEKNNNNNRGESLIALVFNRMDGPVTLFVIVLIIESSGDPHFVCLASLWHPSPVGILEYKDMVDCGVRWCEFGHCILS